jgi:cell division protein FtsB
MKVTPVATGSGVPAQNIGGASVDRLDNAKRVAVGEAPIRIAPSDTPTDPQVKKAQESIRSIKMKVNQTVNRQIAPEAAQQMQTEATKSSAPSAINENNKQGVIEETKPLDPQVAALMKQKRALDVREKQLAEREKALQPQPSQDVNAEFLARLKANPLSVLQEQEILNPQFYEAMTDFLVSGKGQINPELDRLKAEIATLKEGMEKSFTERDSQAETQALNEIRKEANLYLAKDDTPFRLVKASKNGDKAVELIKRVWKQEGELLDTQDALKLVEDHLREELTPLAEILKPQAIQPTPQLQQDKTMRTITNRDAAQKPMDRKTRAILAAQGLLKRG